MKNLKKEKGITLVALIITIVVLLILAVVAIGAVQDSNIIAHAQNAATTYKVKSDEEKSTLSEYESYIEGLNNPWRAAGLKGNVLFDKLYSNIITLDGATQYLQLILYSDGGAYFFEGKTSKEEVAEAIKGGYLKINGNVIEVESDGLKFEFSEDGKEITMYLNGIAVGILDTEEKEPPASEWTTYGTEQMYFLVGTDKAYSILQGNLFATYTIETGTLEGSEEFKNYTIPSHVMGASKVLKNGENIAAVIMPNGDFYKVGIGMNAIQTEKMLASVIDYSSILEQIQ